MKKVRIFLTLSLLSLTVISCGNPKEKETVAEESQTELIKVYDDTADPVEQIQEAIEKAKAENKYVICQVGGNWCPWCLKFAAYISSDEEISKLIDENFVYTHINVRLKNPETGKTEILKDAMDMIGNPTRFGYPVMVVLDQNGEVVHTQDSGYLEDGDSYNRDKVMRFFKNWTPAAVNS